ncbi:MAG: porin [Methylococcales bacterium]|nr:porin [Methylococcales bacterium]
MKNFRFAFLSSAISLALLTPNVHAANHHSVTQNTSAMKTEALERRIRELEHRLEKLDAAANLQQPVAGNTTQPLPEIKKLTNEVHLLERKLEVQDEVATSAAQKAPVIEAGEGGFKISSADKKHQVRIRGAVQVDNRTYAEDSSGLTDSFELKQGRVWLEGYVFKDVAFKIMPDFAASGNLLPDAYLDYTYHSAASLLVGKFKPALSLERLQGDSDGTFLERAFPTYLASNRDVGVQLHGAFDLTGHTAEKVAGPIDTKNQLTYQFGVFNGAGDDGSANNNAKDTDDNKEFVGRLFAHPFQHTGYSWLEGLGLGVAGSYAKPNSVNQALKALQTPIGRNNYLDYTKTLTAGTPVFANGDSYRIYPQAYWYSGSFGAMAEYVVSSQHLSGTDKTGVATNVKQNNTAWQILGSYVLTGEDNSFGGIKPIRPFNPLDGKWGALQFAARYSQLDVDNDTFIFLDPNKSATQARAWTLGANWYLNINALIRADYEQVSFDGGAAKGGDRPTEQVFATRFQLSF